MASISRRKFLQVTSAASLAAAASLPGVSRASNAPVTLRFSASMPADPNASHYVWYQNFAANLKASVGDKIRIDFFPNSQLGKESDVVQQVKIGSTDMMVAGASIWATLAPEIGMLDMGYLFDSFAHANKVLDGHVGAALAKILAGPLGLARSSRGRRNSARATCSPRNRFSRSRNSRAPSFACCRRRPSSKTFKAMGAVPTPIPFGEL
jgi:TRAP-type C4-dicarboxylate transport system, periplasmic component